MKTTAPRGPAGPTLRGRLPAYHASIGETLLQLSGVFQLEWEGGGGVEVGGTGPEPGPTTPAGAGPSARTENGAQSAPEWYTTEATSVQLLYRYFTS